MKQRKALPKVKSHKPKSSVKKRSRKQQSSKSKSTHKKISLKNALDKVVEVVKNPFLNNKSRGIKVEDGQKYKQQNDSVIDVPFAESTSRSSASKFFYSDEATIETFDDQQLYEVVSKHYPGLLATEESELAKRNAIIALLNDVKLMQRLLDEYNMTVLDFFKFLFRLCPSVFKGLFVKKVQKTLKDKPYVQSVKFSNYKSGKKRSSAKRCSIF